jgi:hypothetical protein
VKTSNAHYYLALSIIDQQNINIKKHCNNKIFPELYGITKTFAPDTSFITVVANYICPRVQPGLREIVKKP